MSSYFDDPDAEICPLPQCGFGVDVDFDTLIESNRFLFRVYTPKERSPFSDENDPLFIAPRFDEQIARSPVDLPKVKFSEPLIGSYAEVAQHMEWTTRSSSSYISTSFSFSWSIWEAVRRYHQGIKKDVEIAIIDATALGGRAATAIQLLQKSSPSERTEQYWKWHRFSQDSQSVLVYCMIPRAAVLASVPLIQILRKMPSYFLRKDVQIIHGNPLDQVAWNFTLRKHNYRQFCQDMSKLFLARPTEVRLRDSTAGSVRLALSFLRPFFHRVVQEDFDTAISYLRILALTISVWPGGEWVKDHLEIRRIIESMVLSLAEELKEKYLVQGQGEIVRLQSVINGMQQVVCEHEAKASNLHIDLVEIDSEDELASEFEESDEPTLVSTNIASIVDKPSHLQMSAVALLPRIPAVFQTPITPPESPRNSLFVPTSSVSVIDIVASPLSFKYQEDAGSQEATVVVSNETSPSVEPASPPPTPPSRSPSFVSLALTPIDNSIQEDFHVQFEDEARSNTGCQDSAEQELESTEIAVHDDVNEVDSQHVERHGLEETHFEEEQVVAESRLEEGPIVEEQDKDYGEETDLEQEVERDHYSSPFGSPSWSAIHHVRPKLSSFSSTHSSIASLDTLCDQGEGPFHLKRLSLATTDSFEFVPPYPSFRAFNIPSRTISFSEPSPRAPLSPILDPLEVPLPPSPQRSLESICLTSSLSESASSASSTVSSSPPSPISRTASLESRSSSPSPISQPSVSPSTTSSLHSSPPSSTPTLPLDSNLPVNPPGLIFPPKGRISLLSHLPESQEVDDEDDDDASSVRSFGVSETASYLVTGFLVGAFITLFLFSTQRRQLLALT